MAKKNSNSIAPRGPLGVWRAAKWSLQGLLAAWRLEASFRLEVYVFIVFGPLGLWLGQGAIEKILLVGSLLLLLASELINSAIEALIERYGPEHHELAGMAKDMGSAAVMMVMLFVSLCWGLILVPRYLL